MLEKKYISDIDGLRAFAVLAVILYHLGYKWIPGGFIGVDIFFVISGYLITKNILFDIENKQFSIFDFYVRRARRLFPALFVMLIISFTLAYALFSPIDLERFGESLLYANVSLSNFFFMSEAGYFDTSSFSKPLLHTWSLSVEEQFYLIWPFLLVSLLWLKRKIFILIFLIVSTIISMYFSYTYTETDPSLSFFMLPFRVFEFSIGALVVWAELIKTRHKYVYEFFTALGLVLIVYSALIFTNTMEFPSYTAAVPVVGAGFIIYASRYSTIGMFFRSKIIVWIGLISYSLYLVHWPLIVFYKYWKFEDITSIERILFIIVTFLFGFVLWKYVEKPWRLQKKDDAKTHFIFIVPSLMLLVSFIAANTWGNKGYSNRFPKEYQLSKEEITKERNRYWKPFGQSGNVDKSLLNGTSGEKEVIVMGNSHAIDLVYALRLNGSNLNFKFLSTTHHCSNFGTLANNKDNVQFCEKIKIKNFTNKSWEQVDKIYLHDNWSKIDLKKLKISLKEIRTLSLAPIYVFGPKMIYKEAIPSIVQRHMRMSSINKFSQKFQSIDRIKLNIKLKAFFKDNSFNKKNIFYVDILSSQCGNNMKACEIISSENSKFLYFDGGHFTKEGSLQFGRRLKKDYPEVF